MELSLAIGQLVNSRIAGGDFFAIFSTMIGAVEIAPMLPDPAMREKVLASTRDFLLRSFGPPQS
jgi:hypothetical protein